MKDDLIRNLMSGIDDEFVDEYRASMDKKAAEIAAQSDFMIVIGDRHSSNTNKLFDICKKRCPNTVLIETVGELDLASLHNAVNIGVTAGASTPARIIKEVLDTMSEPSKI